MSSFLSVRGFRIFQSRENPAIDAFFHAVKSSALSPYDGSKIVLSLTSNVREASWTSPSELDFGAVKRFEAVATLETLTV